MSDQRDTIRSNETEDYAGKELSNSANLREVRFRMSLRKNVSFVEWVRLRFDCPLGVRVELKKQAAAQCRKMKRWLQRSKRRWEKYLKCDNLEPWWCRDLFNASTQEVGSIEKFLHNGIGPLGEESDDQELTEESSDTVLYIPQTPALFIPLAERCGIGLEHRVINGSKIC